jgi:peptide/nickel transport system substrate-binding protein
VNTKIVSVLDKDNPITVVGPHEVVVHLKTPSAGFLNQVANVGFAIVAPSALAGHADDIATGAGYVGTGPFRLVGRSIGTSIQLERNPDYAWAPESQSHGGPAYLEKLEIRFLPEIQARIGALTSGQIQGAASIPPALVSVVEAGGSTVTGQEIAGTSYALWLNSTREPFSDPRVRRAFQRSLDIDTLIGSIYRGHFNRAWSISAPLLPNGYDRALENAWPQDTALAASLLAEAGYAKDADGFWARDGKRLSVKWNYNASVIREQRDVLGDAIAAEARKQGFEIVRVALDAGSFAQARKADDYDILDINSQNPDGDSLRLPFFHSAALPRNGGSGNFSNLDNPEIDRLLVEANTTSDPQARWKGYSRVQNFVVLEEALVVPLYVTRYLLGHSPKTDGWEIGLRGVPFNFYNVHYLEN